MVDIKTAIKNSLQFVSEFYHPTEEPIVESAVEKEPGWQVTFRVSIKSGHPNQLQNILGLHARVFYKTIQLDQDGKIIGVLANEPEGAQFSNNPQTIPA
jgi:hypothetical protein